MRKFKPIFTKDEIMDQTTREAKIKKQLLEKANNKSKTKNGGKNEANSN